MELDQDDIQETPNGDSSSGFLMFSKRQKWTIVLFLFLVILSVGFVHVTEYLAGNILQSQVKEHTGGAYSLSYSDIKLQWINPQITLENVVYSRTSPVVDTLTNNAYAFSVSYLDIRIESIFDIYFSKVLHVSSLSIENPELEIRKQKEHKAPSNFSFESGQLYEMLRGFVSTYKMDEIRVDHMHLNYFPFGNQVPFTVNDLSFSIRNFLLDSTAVSENSKFLFSESFDLKIRNQRFLFADSIHFTQVDSLHLSTENNFIKIYGIQTDTILDSRWKMLNKRMNQYYSDIPSVAIVGLDFDRAYRDNVLHVDSIVFQDPDLKAGFSQAQRDISPIQIDTTVENNLVEMVLSVFSRVELDKYIINNSKINVVYGENDTASVEGLDLAFSEFVLDSSDLMQELYYPKFKELELSVDHPKIKLPNKNRLSAAQLTFSTQRKDLIIKDVLLSNFDPNPMRSVEGTIEMIKLNGIDPQEIFDKRRVNLDTLLLVRPNLIYTNNQLEKSPVSPNQSEIFREIVGYHIDHVILEKGTLQMKDFRQTHNNYGVNDLNVHLSNFVLDEKAVENPRFLFSDWVDVDCGASALFIPDIQHDIIAEKTHFDTRGKHIKIQQLKVVPMVTDSSKIKSVINGDLAYLDVKGLNVNSLQKMEKIDVTGFQVRDLNLMVDLIRKDTSSSDFMANIQQMDLVRFQNVDIENVNVSINTDSSSVFHFSDGFLLTKDLSVVTANQDSGLIKLKSDSLNYGASKITIPLHAAKHIVTIQDLSRNSDSSLSVSGFSMRPIPGVSIADTAFNGVIYVPYIELKHFSELENRNSDTLNFGSLLFRKPSVRLKTHPKHNSKQHFSIPSHLKTKLFDNQVSAISLSDVNIENGKLSIESDSTEISLGDIRVHSSQWFISDSTQWEEDRFLWAADVGFRVSDIRYSTPNIENCPSVDSITYEFSKEKLAVYGVYYSNEPVEMEDSLSFYIPKIEVIRPNVYAYVKDTALMVDSVMTSNGLLEWVVQTQKDKKADSTKSNSVPMQIPANIGGFSKVAVNHIGLEHMHTEMRIIGKNNVAPLDIDEFNLHVDSLHFKPNEKMDSNRLFWANDIVFDVENMYTTLDDGLYEFGADQFRVSSKEKRVDLENVSFVPSVFRYEYALYKGHQKDVFTIYSQGVHISGLDYFSLMNNEGIAANYLVVNKTSMDILKDKRIPLPPYKFKKTIPEMFKLLPITVSMDSVAVNDLRIRYEEFPEVGRAPGTINLSKMNILAKNVTNDTALLMKDSILVIQMNALLLDDAYMTFEADYNMLTSDNRFSMSTTVGEMDATQFNSFVEPVYFAKINSGMVEGLDMNVIGNDSVSGGKMGLYYDDLKFSFLDEVSMEKEGFSAKIKSAIGNTLVKQKNKYHAFKRREPVFFVRDTSKGWIGYLIRIHLSGISSSVGLKKHKKDLKKTNKDLWDEFDKNDRKVRKERAKQEKKKARKEK